jgi:hypothetical protein
MGAHIDLARVAADTQAGAVPAWHKQRTYPPLAAVREPSADARLHCHQRQPALAVRIQPKQVAAAGVQSARVLAPALPCSASHTVSLAVSYSTNQTSIRYERRLLCSQILWMVSFTVVIVGWYQALPTVETVVSSRTAPPLYAAWPSDKRGAAHLLFWCGCCSTRFAC